MNSNFFEKNWDKMAKAFDEFAEDSNSYSRVIEWPTIEKLLPDIENKKILDLGCGTGRFTFLLETFKPSHLYGVDLSAEMLNIAIERAKLKNSIAVFKQGNLSDIEQLVGEKYDLVFSSTTFHYIGDLKQLFHDIYSVTNENGTVIISVIHPIYSAQYPIINNSTQNDNNFDENWELKYLNSNQRTYIQPWIEYNETIDNFNSVSYHHTVSNYLNAVIDSGFTLVRLEEPKPPKEWKDTMPQRYESCIDNPPFMIMKLKK